MEKEQSNSVGKVSPSGGSLWEAMRIERITLTDEQKSEYRSLYVGCPAKSTEKTPTDEEIQGWSHGWDSKTILPYSTRIATAEERKNKIDFLT